MKIFKSILIVILIPTGLFILEDLFVGFQHQHPDIRWLRLPALFFWFSALIYTVVFKAVKAEKK